MCHNLILRFISLVYPPILMTDILSQDISYFQQFYIYFFFIDWLFIVVQVYLSPFSCHHFPPPHPSPPPHPQSYHPLALSLGPLYMFLDDPSPSFPHYPLPLSPLVTVNLFFISMSLVVFCLLVLLITFHLQVRSYSICLSPPGLFYLA